MNSQIEIIFFIMLTNAADGGAVSQLHDTSTGLHRTAAFTIVILL